MAPARARLLVVGDGPARPDLERLARDLGLSGRVYFTGIVPRTPATAVGVKRRVTDGNEVCAEAALFVASRAPLHTSPAAICAKLWLPAEFTITAPAGAMLPWSPVLTACPKR